MNYHKFASPALCKVAVLAWLTQPNNHYLSVFACVYTSARTRTSAIINPAANIHQCGNGRKISPVEKLSSWPAAALSFLGHQVCCRICKPPLNPEQGGAPLLTCTRRILPLPSKRISQPTSASQYAPARRRHVFGFCFLGRGESDTGGRRGRRGLLRATKRQIKNPLTKKKGATKAAPFLPLSRKIEGHPNPVRTRMLLEASVKRTLCSLRLPPLDLSGAGFEYNCRHIQHSRVLQIRLTSSNKGLRPYCNQCRALIHSLTRCTQRFRVLFPFALASASSKAEALSFVRCPTEFTFIPLYRITPERRLRLAHHSVIPVQPAARQTQHIVCRAAKYYQDTNLTRCVDNNFSTIFERNMWGKIVPENSGRCYCFRKITQRLFAGISTIASRVSAFFCASSARSRSRSRTPQRGSRDLRLASKASLEGAL